MTTTHLPEWVRALLRESYHQGLARIRREKPRLSESRTLQLLDQNADQAIEVIETNLPFPFDTSGSSPEEAIRKKAASLFLIALNDLCSKYDWKIVVNALRYISNVLAAEFARSYVLSVDLDDEAAAADDPTTVTEEDDDDFAEAEDISEPISSSGISRVGGSIKDIICRNIYGQNRKESRRKFPAPIMERIDLETSVRCQVLTPLRGVSETGDITAQDALSAAVIRYPLTILEGHRGSGKTHALIRLYRNMEINLASAGHASEAIPLYLDLRELRWQGSTFEESVIEWLGDALPTGKLPERFRVYTWVMFLDNAEDLFPTDKKQLQEYLESVLAFCDRHSSCRIVLTAPWTADTSLDEVLENSDGEVGHLRLNGLTPESLHHIMTATSSSENLVRTLEILGRSYPAFGLHPGLVWSIINTPEVHDDADPKAPLRLVEAFLHRAVSTLVTATGKSERKTVDNLETLLRNIALYGAIEGRASMPFVDLVAEFSSSGLNVLQQFPDDPPNFISLRRGRLSFHTPFLQEFFSVWALFEGLLFMLQKASTHEDVLEFQRYVRAFPWTPATLELLRDRFLRWTHDLGRGYREELALELEAFIKDRDYAFDPEEYGRRGVTFDIHDEIGGPFRSLIAFCLIALCQGESVSYSLARVFREILALRENLLLRDTPTLQVLAQGLASVLRGGRWEGSTLSQLVLPGADFSDGFFVGATFDRSVFSDSRWTRTIVEEATFDRCICDGMVFSGVEARSFGIEGSNLEEIRLTGVNAAESQWKYVLLNNSVFQDCSFGAASFQQVMAEYLDVHDSRFVEGEFIGGTFWGSIFDNCNFAGLRVRNTNLQRCVFSNSKFPAADLTGVDLRGSDLSGSDFSGAIVDFADLRGCNLERTRWEGAIVNGARFPENGGLTLEQKAYLREHGATISPEVRTDY